MNVECVAKNLRMLRGNRSIASVARALGISKSTLAMYETAKRIPRDDIKVKIAKYYGLTVETIFFANNVHK